MHITMTGQPSLCSKQHFLLVELLKVCAKTKNLRKGVSLHSHILEKGLFEKNPYIGSNLINMYARCDMLTKAQQVLDGLPVRNVISWNTIIAGYAQHSQGYEALKCLERMERDGLSPNSVTFLCVLNACSHAGLMDEAETFYLSMSNKYGISPSIEHHTCMVMIFGCSGQFDKAISVIKTMESFNSHPVWVALLAACKKWGNVKLGRLAFDQTVQLDNTCAAVYVLMASIYIAAGLQEDAKRVEAMRVKYTAWRHQQNSLWLDASGNDHSFLLGIGNTLK